jgi:hypothetical protein
MNSIMLYGKEVAPLVREAIAERSATPTNIETGRRQPLRA